MKAIARAAGTALAALGAATAVLFPAATATAATPSLPSLIAYVRSGNIYVSKGGTERELTTGGGHSRPRWSPDGTRLAFLKGGQLWTMKADGSAQRRLTTRAAAGPSWSPDGKWIAFASLGCTGGPVVYRIATGTVGAVPEVLFPAECRGQALPPEPQIRPADAGGLSDRLRYDDAVAWAPDGSRIAFRGGTCESTYDACLSIGTIATGREQTVAAYGGGGLQTGGFAVVPSWRGDSARLAFTAYQEGEIAADDRPVHVVEYDLASHAKRTIGVGLDREMAYVDARRGAVTGRHRGGSWIVLVSLETGARTPLRPGSQPSVQPTRR